MLKDCDLRQFGRYGAGYVRFTEEHLFIMIREIVDNRCLSPPSSNPTQCEVRARVAQ